MLYKTRHGHNTGNTLRRRPRRYLDSERYNDGEWTVINRRNPRSRDVISVGPESLPARSGVPYSLKKRRGWEIAEWLTEAMDGGALENDDVELVQGHRPVPMERRERTRRVVRKAAGPDGPLREVNRRRGFINTKSVLTTMRKEEEEDEEQQQQQQKKKSKRRQRRRRNRTHDEDDEEEHLPFGIKQKAQLQERHERRELTFDIAEATIPDTALVPTASLAWAKYYRRQRAFGTLEMEIEEDLEVALDSDLGAFSEEEEEEDVEEPAKDDAAAHSLFDFLFSAVLICPRQKRSNERGPQSGAVDDRKDRQIVVEEPRDDAVRTTFEAALDLEDRHDMAPSVVQLPGSQLHPSALRERFGSRYREAGSQPRAFAVTLGDAPLDDSVPTAAVLLFSPKSIDGDRTACDVILNAEVEVATRTVALPQELAHQQFSDIADFVQKCQAFVGFVSGVQLATKPQTDFLFSASKSSILNRAVAIAGSGQPANSHSESSEHPGDHEHLLDICDDMIFAGNCEICFDSVSTEMDEGCALKQCGHLFCTLCWRQHLIAAIRQGRNRFLCPAVDCSAIVDVITALRFVSLPLIRQQLRRQDWNRLRHNHSVVWCPNPHCSRSICVNEMNGTSSKRSQDMICVCGHSFCISCKQEVHWPASCDAYRSYKAKMKAVGDWKINDLDQPVVHVRGKPCPACKEFIEKLSGCHYMRCACGVGFCWDCGERISHFGHNCKHKDTYSHKKVRFVGEIFTPTGIRSKIYCSSVQFRAFRKTLSCTHLNKARLRALLFEEASGESTHAALIHVQQETRNIIRNYKEILRLTEFACVACLSLHKSFRYEKRQLTGLAEYLRYLAVSIREVINWNPPNNASKSRAKMLRDYFQQAHRVVKTLSGYHGLLSDEKAQRLQF